MANKNIIEISNVTKTYSKVKVVEDLSFFAEEGDIVGLIGPNGAGKSTTIKIILKLINKDSGAVKIEDYNIDTSQREAVKAIGFTSEAPSFYEYLNGYENLKLIANFYKDITDERIKELLEFVGLSEAAKKKVRAYSTGMKQRLGLARALINKPRVVILDEPTNGLDPQGMRDIYNLIKKLALEEKVTFIISSHLLHDVEKICNKVVIINKGKTIYNGDIKSILEKCVNIFNIYTSQGDKVINLVKNEKEVTYISSDINSIMLQTKSADVTYLEKYLVKNSIEVASIEKVKPSLEELFFLMTKEA